MSISPHAMTNIQTLAGPVASKVDSLALSIRSEGMDPGAVPALADLRLFSTGGSSEVIEWDIARGCIKVCNAHRDDVRQVFIFSVELENVLFSRRGYLVTSS